MLHMFFIVQNQKAEERRGEKRLKQAKETKGKDWVIQISQWSAVEENDIFLKETLYNLVNIKY